MDRHGLNESNGLLAAHLSRHLLRNFLELMDASARCSCVYSPSEDPLIRSASSNAACSACGISNNPSSRDAEALATITTVPGREPFRTFMPRRVVAALDDDAIAAGSADEVAYSTGATLRRLGDLSSAISFG